MPRSSKRASERQSETSSRSPWTTWIAIAVWPSLKVVNSCAARHRDRRVARDDLLGEAAHRLEAERQRDHVEQQPVVARCVVAGEQVGLDGRAERDDLVGVDVRQRRLAEKPRHRLPQVGHPRRPAHHNHAVDVGDAQAGIRQGLAGRCQRLVDEARRHPRELLAGQRHIDHFPGREHGIDAHLGLHRQTLLCFARLHHQQP
jgi:hypothetical protein